MQDLDLVGLNHQDPYNYATARFAMEHQPGMPEKHALDLSKESYAGSLLQISRPKSSIKSSLTYNSDQLKQLLLQIDDWNWKIFEFSEACPGGKPLYLLSWHMFDVNHLFEEFRIPLDKFNNFIWKIQDGYRDLQCTSTPPHTLFNF
jgi:hypothetical protein